MSKTSQRRYSYHREYILYRRWLETFEPKHLRRKWFMPNFRKKQKARKAFLARCYEYACTAGNGDPIRGASCLMPATRRALGL